MTQENLSASLSIPVAKPANPVAGAPPSIFEGGFVHDDLLRQLRSHDGGHSMPLRRESRAHMRPRTRFNEPTKYFHAR